MSTVLFAHGNGWDEILMAVVVFAVIGALLLSARSRANAQEQGAAAELSAEPGDDTSSTPGTP